MGTKIGFIGLGIMGAPMAKNLLRSGVELMICDADAAREESLTACGAHRGDYREIGEKCDIVFTILPNGDIVKSVLFGSNGVALFLKSGSLVCDMSSVTPVQSRFCHEKLLSQGCGFVDAPVSGGEPGAISGTLAFMCGGEKENFERLLPFFEIMGKHATLVGEAGSGSMTKLANQIIVNLNIAAVSEALVLASKAGVDPMKVFLAIRGGLAGSAVLEAKAPMMCARNFNPGGKISINHKDIKNVLDTAHELDVPVPLSAQLFEIMQALKVSGHMGDDHGGIVQYFEKLAETKVESELRM